MLPDKFERCYEEGKIIGFVLPTDNTDIFGKPIYKKCRGESETSQSNTLKFQCLKCRFLDRKKNRRK